MQATGAGQWITFGLGLRPYFLLGLDDWGYATQTYPSLKHVRGSRYMATRDDASAILDSLGEHALDSGFEHSSAERRALRDAARRLRAAIDAAALTHAEG